MLHYLHCIHFPELGSEFFIDSTMMRDLGISSLNYLTSSKIFILCHYFTATRWKEAKEEGD